MSLATPIAPFYSGTGVSPLVPGAWPVALNGRPYAVDTKNPAWGRQSIPLLRQQADNAAVPAEGSLNPEELWRRAVESWHHGAGQTRFDRPDSDPARYRSSKGVDPWTRWGISLLPDTASIRASANTNLFLAVAGDWLYMSDGSSLYATQDLAVAPAAVAYAGGAVKAISSDGYNIYVTDGADIRRFARGAAGAGASWNAQDADLLVYVKGKGRLMAALNTGATRSVFNVTGTGAPTDIAPGIISADFTWTGFAESGSVIYGVGYQGDKSLVFRWGIKADGTGLDAAVPALPDGLPDGEIVRGIGSYLGYVLLGTDKGVRFCDSDASGNLAVGSLITTDHPVRCFEGQERFVWYGLENYDGSSTGLGRLDLTTVGEIAPLTPGWASDLMAAGQGQVTSVATFQGRRVFAVAGLGFFAEQATKVAVGTLEQGEITFGLPDDKVALYVDVRHDALTGSVAAALAADGGMYMTVGANSDGGTTDTVLPAQTTAERFEPQLTLTRDGADTAAGPTVTRLTLEANPAPGRGEHLIVPLLLHERVNVRGVDQPVDVQGEYDALVELEASGRPFTYQDHAETSTVFLDDHQFDIYGPTGDGRSVNGTFVAKLRRPRRRGV